MVLQSWKRLPTNWIKGNGLDHGSMGLRQFRWSQGNGSSCTAALMLLIVIAHHADDEGSARLTYDLFNSCTTLSRAKISSGLEILNTIGIVLRAGGQRNAYKLANYDRTGWGMLPAKKLYDNSGQIRFFKELSLRNRTELHALKLYLLFIAMRDNDTNMAQISYNKIEEYLGIPREHIKSGLSLLAANSLIHVEQIPSREKGVFNAYRIIHLQSNVHMGTAGRRLFEHLAAVAEPA